jgi:hypothetical protein
MLLYEVISIDASLILILKTIPESRTILESNQKLDISDAESLVNHIWSLPCRRDLHDVIANFAHFVFPPSQPMKVKRGITNGRYPQFITLSIARPIKCNVMQRIIGYTILTHYITLYKYRTEQPTRMRISILQMQPCHLYLHFSQRNRPQVHSHKCC